MIPYFSEYLRHMGFVSRDLVIMEVGDEETQSKSTSRIGPV